MNTTSVCSYYDSPCGRLLLTSDGAALTGLYFPEPAGGGPGEHPAAGGDDGPIAAAREQLAEWFAGERTTFDLPLRLAGTPFQQRVWRALVEIPYGATISYAELATRIGRPTAVRAVGAANGRNPVSIIVPCHRVIGADGSLTGYGGGLERKAWFLAHETRMTKPR